MVTRRNRFCRTCGKSCFGHYCQECNHKGHFGKLTRIAGRKRYSDKQKSLKEVEYCGSEEG
jgi:hypothetical protein